jgi:ATP-dependent Lon protease
MAEVKLPVEEELPSEEVPAEPTLAEPSDEEFKPEIPSELNILPLRDSVIYPMLIAPLSVARESSVQLIDESIVGNNRVIGVITQRKAHTEAPGFEDVYEMGCAVIIRTLVKMPDAVRLIVQGVSRFRIVERIHEQPYLRAKVEVVDEPTLDEEAAEETEALRRSVAALFEQAIRLSPQLPDELRTLTQAVSETNVMCDLVAAHMTLNVEDKQKILETVDVPDRLRNLLEMLSKEVRVLELTSKVQSEVNTELSKSQREYYLREQLKAIQRELGESDERGEDLEELRTKIDESGMPEEALREVNREYDRLRRMSPGAPEYTVARTYIDWMVALPWTAASEDRIELPAVKEVLDEDHYGLEKIKDRIVEFLAVRKVKTDGKIRQPILCFVGPPGVGKTSLGKSIAHAMSRKFVRISLGGMRDEAEIRGHRRTYIGALPGQIIQGLRRVETNNPVFMLDEIDKLGMDFRGDPASALLEVLDPEQNASFRDHYVDAPFDLSRVFFITTANVLDTIPPPLRDRMEVIEIGGYTEEEKVEIAFRHLIPKQIEEHGLKPSQISFERDAVRRLVRFYTREAGVRNLEREIASVVRKATRAFAEGRSRKLAVNKKYVETALGAPRYLHALWWRRAVCGDGQDAGQEGPHPHRAARRRDERIGDGGAQLCAQPVRPVQDRPQILRRKRNPRPRARRRGAEGRPERRHHDADGAGLPADRAQHEAPAGHDRRSDAYGAGAPCRGNQREGFGRASRRSRDTPAARREPQGLHGRYSRGDPRRAPGALREQRGRSAAHGPRARARFGGQKRESVGCP